VYRYFQDCNALLGAVPSFSFPATGSERDASSGASIQAAWASQNVRAPYHLRLSSLKEAMEDMLQSLRPVAGAPDDASDIAVLEALPRSILVYDLAEAADRQKVFYYKFHCLTTETLSSSRQLLQGASCPWVTMQNGEPTGAYKRQIPPRVLQVHHLSEYQERL
jgi:hypothetical protein